MLSSWLDDYGVDLIYRVRYAIGPSHISKLIKDRKKKTVGEKVEWYDNHVTMDRKDAISFHLFNVSFC